MFENVSSFVNGFIKYFDFPYMLFDENNPMSINSKLEKNTKKCGSNSPKLLSVESNILIVSWGQICNNPLATIAWRQILSKENDILLPNYLFFVYLLC